MSCRVIIEKIIPKRHTTAIPKAPVIHQLDHPKFLASGSSVAPSGINIASAARIAARTTRQLAVERCRVSFLVVVRDISQNIETTPIGTNARNAIIGMLYPFRNEPPAIAEKNLGSYFE
jgi:hypothetical protein